MTTYPAAPLMICGTCGTPCRVWWEDLVAQSPELPEGGAVYMGACLNGTCPDYGNKAKITLPGIPGNVVIPKERVE